MPQLSPASWILIPAIFWFTLILSMSILWWQQAPKMPAISQSKDLPLNTWNWSW